MFIPKFMSLLLAILVLLLASVINCANIKGDFGDGLSPPNSQGACPPNCTICQYPDCTHPPPHAGNPGYVAPPPPPAAPAVGCPPPPPGQCCGQPGQSGQYGQYSPPYPYTFYNQTGSASSSANVWASVVLCLLMFASV